MARRATVIALAACLLAGSTQAAPTALTGMEPNTVALFDLNEFAGNGSLVSAGTDVIDSSPNGLTGKTGLTVRTYKSDDLGTGFGNNLRADARVYLPGNTLSPSLYEGDFTMEMWVRNGAFLNSSGAVNSESALFSSSGASGAIGWIIQIHKNANGTNNLKVHNGAAWTTDVLTDFVLPAGSGWSHWAAVFTNTNPGAADSSYSVSLYVTPATASELNLIGTFQLNPAMSTTNLATVPLIFNGDLRSGGKGFSVAQPADLADSMRLSNIARTSFESFAVPEPLTVGLLGLAIVPLVRRRS